MSDLLLVLVLLQVKHFIVDFPLQPAWMYLNKGTWMHPGGLVHAGLHGFATGLILLFFVSPAAVAVFALLESAAHYLIDFAKVRINKRAGWGPTTHEQFWWLLGFDQLLHQLCYLGIVWAVFA